MLPAQSPERRQDRRVSATAEAAVSRLHWDRLTVLIVDDNNFVCELLTTTLRNFGIGTVEREADGAAAIERLKNSMNDPIAAKLGTVDLVLSDYVMPNVDGLLFLRWLRTGDGVPDRFVPFIMVSGAADREVVEQARNAGVTEFLAKPFSARAIADRLLHVINNPRMFVLAPRYFGPDRRRTAMPVAVDRRNPDTSDIQVVHRRSKARSLREDVRAIHFQISNRLADKLGANLLKGQVDIDPALIRAAEQRIQAMVGDYSDWVAQSIDSMVASHAALKEGGGDPKAHVLNINAIAHELRGQGGIFDYPLITACGKSLYEATQPSKFVNSPQVLDLIQAHIDTIRTVFKNKIKGDGGEVGTTLLADIEIATRKFGSLRARR